MILSRFRTWKYSYKLCERGSAWIEFRGQRHEASGYLSDKEPKRVKVKATPPLSRAGDGTISTFMIPPKQRIVIPLCVLDRTVHKASVTPQAHSEIHM